MPNIDNNWKTKKMFSQNNNWKNKIKRNPVMGRIKRKGLGNAPQGISSNIFAPELAPRDNRFTGRNKQLGLRVKPEFLKRLKELAVEEDCFLVEVLEKALESYEKQRKNK